MTRKSLSRHEHTDAYEDADKRAFMAIHDYRHPGISSLDAEFIADEVLHALGYCKRYECVGTGPR